MKTTISHTVKFGRDGNACAYQVYGWSLPEDGFCWTDGKAAGLVMPVPESLHGFYLELFSQAHGYPDGRGGQRLVISVNGNEIARCVVYGRARLAWYVPPLMRPVGKLVINFALPDAHPPQKSGDQRVLGIAAMSLRVMPLLEPARFPPPRVAALPPAHDAATAREFAERITGLAVPELALTIESLGVNCEPGFFQRKCGVEPLGLLRFSGVILHSLVSSIDDGFPGLGNAETIEPLPDEADLKDWIVYERKHLLRYHTWVRVPDASVDAIKSREVKRLPFLKNKLLEDLENGEKIFVHQHNRTISDHEILPLYLAIRRRGPGTLLCITPADQTHPVGLVEEILPGLMRGYFSHFSAAGVGKDLSMPEWLAVCTNAWLLMNNAQPPES